jgi:5'-nucleotidase
MPFADNEGEQIGGYARIKAYKDSIEAHGREVLMLSSGDIFQGTFFYKFFQGIPDILFMNSTGYDAMTLGNHEFDCGQPALAEAINYAQFPMLAANIQFKKIPELQSQIKPWVMLETAKSKTRVAVIGLVVENLDEIVPAVFVSDFDVVNAEKALRRYLPEIQKENPDMIILLSHLGWERELELFALFPEIDGVLGGHTHLAISPPAVVEGERGHRFMSQPGEWGKAVTRYDIVLNPKDRTKLKVQRASLVPMSKDVCEDEKIKAEATSLWQQIQVKVNIPIGKAKVFLNGDRKYIRNQETNLGNLVADCIARSADAEMAVINGGGIRSSIATGTITIGDCLNVLPFDNYLVKVEMTGETLLNLFEQVRQAISTQTGFGGFLQVSEGLEVKYFKDTTRVFFNEQPVEPQKHYIVATNDFLAGGGNGLTSFIDGVSAESTGLLAADAFIKFIKENETIEPSVEGRITIDLTLPQYKLPPGILKTIPECR